MSFMSLGVLIGYVCLSLWVLGFIDNFTIMPFNTSAHFIKYMYICVYLPQFETESCISPQLSRMVENPVHVCTKAKSLDTLDMNVALYHAVTYKHCGLAGLEFTKIFKFKV